MARLEHMVDYPRATAAITCSRLPPVAALAVPRVGLGMAPALVLVELVAVELARLTTFRMMSQPGSGDDVKRKTKAKRLEWR